jgi:hypothetical protein
VSDLPLAGPAGARAADGWRAVVRARPWELATAALLAVAGALVAATFQDYGSTWDEYLQAELGRDVVAWFTSAGADTRALSGGSIGNLHLYGALFEAAAELAGEVLPFDPFEARHLLNALVALSGVAGAALLARRLGGPRAAFLAAALLLTTPAWWGHGFANSKDVPFAAAYPWLVLALLRAGDELPRPRLRWLLAAGAALGMALAVRPGGLVLLLPLSAGIVAIRLLPALRSPGDGRVRAVGAAGGRLAAVAVLGWLGMLAVWPYGLVNPLSGPAAAVAAAKRFAWDGPVRFGGHWSSSLALPRSYAPTWFLSTLPETWLAVAVAAAAAAVLAWRRDRVRPALSRAWLDPALVAVAALGPIAATVVLRPVLYDGVRHLLFCVPALAALAGWALSAAVDRLPRWGGRAALAVTGAAALLVVTDAVRLHPYQYLYFNRLVAGGLERAGEQLELDYWGATGREAARWIAANVPPRGDRPIAVKTTADPSVVAHWLDPAAQARFAFDFVGRPDLRLASTRWFEHRATGKVLHVVERMGVPLLYVIDPAPQDELVLEAGDAALALTPGAGWSGEPRVVAGEDRAVYQLSRWSGALAKAEIQVLTPRTDAVPTVEALREEVARAAAHLAGVAPAAIDPRRVDGPQAHGWITVVGPAEPSGAPFAAVAGARVGGAAFLAVVRCWGDRAEAVRELVAWTSGAHLAPAAERRPP